MQSRSFADDAAAIADRYAAVRTADTTPVRISAECTSSRKLRCFREPSGRRCPRAAYNLGNFLRSLALPRAMDRWSLTTLREKLVKIGAKVITHARYTMFQMAEVAVPQGLFRRILDRIDGLRSCRVALY